MAGASCLSSTQWKRTCHSNSTPSLAIDTCLWHMLNFVFTALNSIYCLKLTFTLHDKQIHTSQPLYKKAYLHFSAGVWMWPCGLVVGFSSWAVEAFHLQVYSDSVWKLRVSSTYSQHINQQDRTETHTLFHNIQCWFPPSSLFLICKEGKWEHRHFIHITKSSK